MRYGDGQGAVKTIKAIAAWHPRLPKAIAAWFGDDYATARAITLQATGLWAFSRLGLALLTYFTLLLHKVPLVPRSSNPSVSFTELVLRWNTSWDANYYRIIGLSGYPPGTRTYGAFFPLYPILIQLASHVVGSLLAPMVVSNLGTLVAFIGVGFLARHEAGDAQTVGPTLRALASYPLAFFLFAPYSEGVSVACIVWALLWMRQGRWYPAAVATLLATLTRQTGFFLAVPLVVEYARQHDWGRAIRWRQAPEVIACLVAGPLGLAMFSAVEWKVYGKPYVWVSMQIAWGHHFMLPWTGLIRAFGFFFTLPLGSYWQGRLLIDLIPLLVVLVLTIALVRKQPLSYTLYLAALLLIILMSPVVDAGVDVYYIATGRYMLLAIPAFLVFGRWMQQHRWLDTSLTSIGFLLQAAFVTYFLLGGWLI